MKTNETILINVGPQETRVALLENEVLQELRVERATAPSIVGNIYKGKVTRVMPSMQAAFVDCGLNSNGFLHVRDIHGSSSNHIEDAVHEGQTLTLQVMRDPINQKGARLTTQLSLATRYLVYLPQGSEVAISHKISNEGLRQQLTQALLRLQADHALTGGFVLRTAAANADEKTLDADMRYLSDRWSKVQHRMQNLLEQNKNRALVYTELGVVERCLRNMVTDNTVTVCVDDDQQREQLKTFLARFMPDVHCAVEYVPKPFSSDNVEQQIQAALLPTVALPCGGNIVIEHTEAMTTIDVNTASFVGKQASEQSILQANFEAIHEIARQCRLRNLSGIIIIDFIDMHAAQHKRKIVSELKQALTKDSAMTTVSELSNLGLLELTRRRSQPSLQQLLCEPCSVCQGSGVVKSAETVSYEILRALDTVETTQKAVTVVAAPMVIDVLNQQYSHVLNRVLAQAQQMNRQALQLRADPDYLPDQFEIAVV